MIANSSSPDEASGEHRGFPVPSRPLLLRSRSQRAAGFVALTLPELVILHYDEPRPKVRLPLEWAALEQAEAELNCDLAFTVSESVTRQLRRNRFRPK